ncbi:tetratricopeptide repeat protein [Aridibaculum aurantiacum]|uniref:tetratricopeptide repeat protein n=1 Tax=Aridibaculum aurantiacum TaxID=2810307 RepID=UPI001A963150|nr:tetratricopeptide repeat protein [Aridibaculum aurantiacum]
MKRLSFFILSLVMAAQTLVAQTIDEAKQSLYYGRTTSARATLDKLISANPKNAEAIYWLGQTHLANDDVAGARTVYQNALNAGVNDPIIWVGMGHVEMLQGQKDAARQRFESAITNSMRKVKRENVEDVNILTAIGRANADGPSTIGDPIYAVEKLKRAVQLDPNNVDAFINLGINYLKIGSDRGGDAYEAFTNAIRVQANNARARFRLGKIFQSQGNTERFLEYYNQAVTSDPNYGPGYLELYNYYANRDVNKAREYLEKYIANSDRNCETEFFYADYLFRAGKYQESLNKAKELEAGICKDYPRMKVLYAYNYDRLGDSLQARRSIESYLSTAAAEKIQPADYELAGMLMLKFPGEETKATSFLEKAMAADTTTSGKISYITTISDALGKAGQYGEQLNWMRRLATVKQPLTNRDMYIFADAAIRARQYTAADSMSRAYIAKYPDQEYGYSLLVRTAKAADTVSNNAFDEVEMYIDFLTKQDAAKNVDKIKREYYYMATVASDRLKNYGTALEIVNRILAIDPNDAFASQAKAPLERAVAGPKAAPKAAPKKKG